MATPGRDNGLHARSYAPLADLDPRLADAMLELLRESGIAAYAAPAGSQSSGQFGAYLPARPTDRLHVDTADVERARALLQTQLPDTAEQEGAGGVARMSARDEGEVWREIVASYDVEPTDPVPPWPANEDLDDEERDGKGDKESKGGRDGKAGAEEAVARGRVVREPGGDPDDEGHFHPPPPPPLPRPHPVARMAWAGLFGGPGYLFVATALNWPLPGWAAFLAVAAFIAGFVTLVLRMNDGPPQDSGPDDGAVV